MGENTPNQPNSAKIPKKPAWISDFDKRVALIKVISKAFDPDCDPKEVVEDLRRAAKDLEGTFLPETPQAVIPKR